MHENGKYSGLLVPVEHKHEFATGSFYMWLQTMKQRKELNILISGTRMSRDMHSSLGSKLTKVASSLSNYFRQKKANRYRFSHISSEAPGLSVHHFGPDENISTTTGWIVMKTMTVTSDYWFQVLPRINTLVTFPLAHQQVSLGEQVGSNFQRVQLILGFVVRKTTQH